MMPQSGTGQVSKVDNRKSDLSVISSFEYQRDGCGNPTRILRDDACVVHYEYDDTSQLTKETHRDTQGQTVYAWEWDYDQAGNRSTATNGCAGHPLSAESRFPAPLPQRLSMWGPR